jgi:hypothetical protein
LVFELNVEYEPFELVGDAHTPVPELKVEPLDRNVHVSVFALNDDKPPDDVQIAVPVLNVEPLGDVHMPVLVLYVEPSDIVHTPEVAL